MSDTERSAVSFIEDRDTTLPPLPEPYLSAQVTASLLGPNVVEPLFTADQMRAYAAAAVAAAVAAERARLDALYEVVSRIVELDHAINITRLHDYLGGTIGIPAGAVDGGPCDDSEEVAAAVAAAVERCAMLCEQEAALWRGEQDITDFKLCAARIRAENQGRAALLGLHTPT